MREDEYRAMYDLEDQLWWYVGMRAITASLLDAELAERTRLRLLDVGCGTGYSLNWLRGRYPVERAYGVDLSPHAAALWRLREGITESLAPHRPYKNDIAVRISAVPAFLADIQELLAREYPQFDVVWFGHIGDGNLHINVLQPADLADGEFVAQCERVTQLLADTLARHGGSISAEHGIGLVDAHVVDRIAVGGRWHCADGCGLGGVIDDPLASPMAAAAVLDGRRLYRRRTDLQALVATDPLRATAVRGAIEQCARRRGAARSDADARRDIEHAIAMATRVAEDGDLTDEDAARLACALTDLRVRDTLYGLAVGECAAAAETLWSSLARILPMPWRVEALVLLAFSAYARGDGPLAGISLTAALDGDNGHRMAVMLDQALQSGLRPEQIRELAATGYRLADDLGVRLPPRRSFRQRAV